VAVYGEWGSAEDIVYSNWEEKYFDIPSIKARGDLKFAYGLDFGYMTSYNAFVAVAYDPMTRTMWIYDEMYMKGMTNLDIAKKIVSMGYAKEKIWADSAEPKSISELQEGLIEERTGPKGKEYVRYSLPRIIKAAKGPDSVSNGISRLQEYHVIIHPTCRNFILEINNYAWAKDKDGNYTGKPDKLYDHLMDAWRYALSGELLKGHGAVIEAKGDDTAIAHTTMNGADSGAFIAPPVNTLANRDIISAEGPADVAPPHKRVCRVFSSVRYE